MGIQTATMGRWSAGRKTVFKCRAPEARDVHLAGSFTQWDAQAVSMKRGRDGTWTAQVTLPPGRHEYRFIVDGTWQNDPGCGLCAPNPYGSMNCAIEIKG